jgi:DNA-binding response OmpR family regulator
MTLSSDRGLRGSTAGDLAYAHAGAARVAIASPRWPLRVIQIDSPAVPGRLDEPHGIRVEWFPDALGVLLALGADPPAAVVAPTDMVGAHPLGFVEAVSAMTDVPVIIALSHHEGAADLAYAAVASGARSILPLPCRAEQLFSAVRAAGAHPGTGAEGVLEHADLRLDVDAFRATLSGREVPLTPREFLLLRVLIQSSPRVLSAHELAHQLSTYDDGTESATRALELRVRKKLDAIRPGGGDLVETVRSIGYRIRRV